MDQLEKNRELVNRKIKELFGSKEAFSEKTGFNAENIHTKVKTRLLRLEDITKHLDLKIVLENKHPNFTYSENGTGTYMILKDGVFHEFIADAQLGEVYCKMANAMYEKKTV